MKHLSGISLSTVKVNFFQVNFEVDMINKGLNFLYYKKRAKIQIKNGKPISFHLYLLDITGLESRLIIGMNENRNISGSNSILLI